jgi:serine/threonine protein kinase
MSQDADEATTCTAGTDANAGEQETDASVNSSGTQTRFSFYNAKDFDPKETAEKKPKKSSSNSPKPKQKKKETASAPNRFNFYNADEVNAPESTSSTHSNEQQNTDILRSLKEHEQQRSDILGESVSKSSTVRSPVELASQQSQGSSNSNSNSNPYEDAIKDALDLLRKHRYAGADYVAAANDTQQQPQQQQQVPPQQQQQRVLSPATATATLALAATTSTTATPKSASFIKALQVQLPNQNDQDDAHDYNNEDHDEEEYNDYEDIEDAEEDDDDDEDEQEAKELKQQLQNLVARSDPPSHLNDDLILQTRAWDTGAMSPTGTETSLGEVYQAEIEARRKQRQERMAKYANRLAELKQDGDTDNNNSSSPWAASSQIPSQTPSWEERPSKNQPSAAAVDAAKKMLSPFLDTAIPRDANVSQTGSMSTLSKHDEEVQRGVERVLLAILERANSQGRANPSNSWQQGEEKKSALLEEHAATLVARTKEQDDALVKAMSDLLGSASSDDKSSLSALGRQLQHRPEPIIPDTQALTYDNDLSLATQSKELTLNNSSQSHEDMFKDLDSSASAGAEQHHNSGKPKHDHVASKPKPVTGVSVSKQDFNKFDTSVESHADEIDAIVQNVRVKRGLPNQRQIMDNGLDDSFDQRARKILDDSKSPDSPKLTPFASPGVGGDTDDSYVSHHTGSSHSRDAGSDESESDRGSESTGESDDDSYTDDDDGEEDEDTHPGTLDGVLGPLSRNDGGTTGVVLEADMPPKVASPSILDSLSAAMSMVQSVVSFEDSKKTKDRYMTAHDDDPESEELMRTLCAHLLPVGMDQKSELLDQIPCWDESNPDEAGYRIIRLTRGQLRRIEKAFENMVTSLKKNSVRNLAEANESDEAFERDLRAAEVLLDREEKKLKATERTLASVEKEKSGSVSAEKEDEDDCLVAFPGIRPTGKGEMGDLEYFNLPIIFKSHVTGFEPTKDMFLEAGNVVAGQYLVEGELGSAAFSTAYKCLDLNSEGDSADGHEEVCLKVIKNTKDFFDQSLDEIKILELLRQSGRCEEKCIVEMRTFFYHREHLIIVTELLRQNLFEFNKFINDNDEEPYFTMPRLSYITKQCLIALDFVHSLGLVHSDVKPENILLSSYSRAQIKLIDFGSSCYLTDRQSSYIQSRSYRAPEVVLGLPYDGRIDVWSLGCVVAEMFTGDVTFQNDSIVSMLSRIEALCGPFPRHMSSQGRQSSSFFTKCGLLYEKVSSGRGEGKEGSSDGESSGESDGDDDKGKPKYCDIFQPKATTLSARLGFAPDLLKNYDSGKRLSKESKRQALFVDFIRKLLTIDPETRPTAAEALKHPWIKYASSLTEDDVKYPSSD